jgi:hypothetical protein
VWWTVPDLTNADPGTPEDQIRGTAASVSLFETVSNAMAPVLGLLGADAPAGPTTGGGGGSGAYMFASLEELDGVIQQWQDLIDDIKSDQGDVERAVHRIDRPAGDDVSSANYRQSSDVVQAMQKHNDMLLRYAEHYLVKLKDCREQMATTEHGNRTRMNQVH